MSQKKIALGVLAVLTAVLVFGTFQLIGGDEAPSETTDNIGFNEVRLDHEPYLAVRNSGGESAYAGVDDENQSFVYNGENEYGPYLMVMNFWSTEDEPVYVAIDTDGEKNIYHGDRVVENIGMNEIIIKPTVMDGEVVYHKAEVKEDILEQMKNIDTKEKRLTELFRELAFQYSQNRTSSVMDISLRKDGDEIGESFETIIDHIEVDGELAYRVVEDGKEFIVLDGIKQKEYRTIRDMQIIDGEIAYIASQGGEEFVVHGSEEGERYDSVSELTSIGGEPGYIAVDKDYSFVVVDGEESDRYGAEYHGLENLVEAEGEPAYIARKISGPFVVVGDTQYNEYSAIYDMITIDGNAVYSVFDGEDEFLVSNEDEMERFTEISSFVEVNGSVAYSANNDNGKVFVRREGERLGTYNQVTGPVEIGGKTAFTYSPEDSEKQKVYYGGRESKEYDEIVSIADIDGKPVFVAERNKNQYLVEFIKG